ncbi:MAG: glycosyltransferase family 2 protein [Candidatus Marinimicrobia bacterium]|nr:glycosyltransferase family 2 protein [Candidatus Neomarinimicrobiota bacterium]
METSFIYIIYGISVLYFSFLFAAFIFSFIKDKNKIKKDKNFSEPRSFSIVILINTIDDFIEENVRGILNQKSEYLHLHEFIVIDRTNNLELLKEIGYDYPDIKKMYFQTPKMTVEIIREILEHKSSGERFLFIHSNDAVSENWLTSMEKYSSHDTDVILGKHLIAVDEEKPQYFRAIDQLYKSVLQRTLSRFNFTAYSRFTNLMFKRRSFLENINIREMSKEMIGDDPETTIISTVKQNIKALVLYKLEENIWKNELIDKSVLNISFYILSMLMNILPLVLFLAYLKSDISILAMIIIMFGKFIGEGLVISRGARIYSMQNLLNDFWGWYFFNPPLSFVTFILSAFIPSRFYMLKKNEEQK